MDELLATTTLCTAWRERPFPTGLGIVGVSGGGVAHVSDLASAVGLDIPQLQPETVTQLHAILPAFITPQNPLDTTGLPFADGDVYRQALVFLSGDAGIGLITAVQDAPPVSMKTARKNIYPLPRALWILPAPLPYPCWW